jgi:hypothetical protein
MPDENLPELLPKDEIALRVQQDINQYRYGIALLEAQERDREADRELNRYSQKTSLKLLYGLGMIAAIITIAAFYFGKEDFLKECLYALVLASGGGGIGYTFGFRRGRRPKN